MLGFAGLPGASAHQALLEAIGDCHLTPAQVWAVMRTECGDYTRADWGRAMTAAENSSNESIASDLAEEIDLHELFQIGAAAQSSPSP